MSTRGQTDVLTRNKPGYRSFALRIFDQMFMAVTLLTAIREFHFKPFLLLLSLKIEVRMTLTRTVQSGNPFFHLCNFICQWKITEVQYQKCMFT